MFCPDCGIEERHSNQFCRACGSDLRRVRTIMAAPDSVTASASGAREEIGRAVADRIRQMSSAKELAKVTEEVLPEIEKFLESPEEKRLRRMRVGTILSSVGLGAAIGMLLVSFLMQDEDILFLAGLGVVAFFIGLGFLLNGFFLSVPRKAIEDRSSDADAQRRLDLEANYTSELKLPDAPAQAHGFASVTEHTTRHLKETEPKH
ncbi:MAG: hypothetical protein KF855_07185 [Acidobacteria bacterium]|nr:hypothetical protein [Acidobacteriota bacterium]